MITDVYSHVENDYAERDFSAGVPRFDVGRITQLTEPHKSKALETMDIREKIEKALKESSEKSKPTCNVFLSAGKAETALDRQVGGNHYKDCKIQPIEYIHANNLNFCEANIVKYITRWRAKGGLQDVEKVIHYAQLLLELEKKNA